MHYLWPQYLWCLLLAPLLPALYLWLLHRRARTALRLPSLHIARAAAGSRWRRHVPPALLFVALTLLLLALSRPSAPVRLPWAQSTILLAMDVSLSMRVADVKPSRMVAAQETAKSFLAEVPGHVDVGLVALPNLSRAASRLVPEATA